MSGRTIAATRLRSVGALKTYDPPLQALVGRAVDGWTRHGKFLDMSAADLHLVIHLARAGWVRWRERVTEARPTLRGPLALQVELEGGGGIDITEQGTEHRLALYVVRDASDVPGIARLGVDVLDESLTAARLGELLSQRRGQLKTVIADQSLVAGVGNAYSDEVLHAARLSPFKQATALSADETERLHAALRTVMGDAVEARVASTSPTSSPTRSSTSRCTAAPASRARCAATPSARCRCRRGRSSTAPPANRRPGPRRPPPQPASALMLLGYARAMVGTAGMAISAAASPR